MEKVSQETLPSSSINPIKTKRIIAGKSQSQSASHLNSLMESSMKKAIQQMALETTILQPQSTHKFIMILKINS
ncbi:MAG: hypothetical protein SOX21_01560, partial [Candidatus Enterosoma sp.]|nr:hypothetical protein [Candidatus Enterosoma sp.]